MIEGAAETEGPDWMLETALPGEIEAILAEPVAPEPEPVTAEIEPVAPESEPVMADVEPVTPEPQPEPVQVYAPEPEIEPTPVPIKPDTGLLYGELLTNAKESLSTGAISEALAGYSRLIRRKRHLNVVIEDLNDALYRHPVDTNLLETLGDAYVKSNSLQQALDTYTKAEDLLRQ